jgi:3',5'-cyclic AMP phosphodiesterase CpdA
MSKSFLAFSCLHSPVHDKAGVNWLVAKVRRYKPDVVVNLGDTLDVQSLSKFAKSNLTELKHEYDEANKILERVVEASPGAKHVWMMGNHEERLWREEQRHLSSLLDFRKHMPVCQHWQTFDYRFDASCTYKLGQVTFAHGFHTSDTACKSEAVMLGVENGLYVHGHTHRPHDKHRINYGSLRLKNWIANPGCFIQPDVDYMRTKNDSLWGQGVIVGEANDKVRHDGHAHWEAKLVLRRMNWDE